MVGSIEEGKVGNDVDFGTLTFVVVDVVAPAVDDFDVFELLPPKPHPASTIDAAAKAATHDRVERERWMRGGQVDFAIAEDYGVHPHNCGQCRPPVT